MIGEINQENLYLLLPSKICWLSTMLAQDRGITLLEAIKKVYFSKLYQKLQTENTKMWHLGPVDLFTELKKEV